MLTLDRVRAGQASHVEVQPTWKEAPPVTVTAKLLIVEDSKVDAASLIQQLQAAFANAITCVHVETLQEAIKALSTSVEAFDIVLLDLTLPDCSGVPTLARLQPYAGMAAVIVVSGQTDAQHMVRLQGAAEFVHKGETDEIVKLIIGKIREQRVDRLKSESLTRGLESVASGIAELRSENKTQSATIGNLSGCVSGLAESVEKFADTIEGRDGVDSRLAALEDWRGGITTAVRWTVRCVAGAGVATAVGAFVARLLGGHD